MKTISCWQDLEKYGIMPLTGEACGLSLRFLCDVNEQGKNILEKMLGCKLNLAENWNNYNGAIGSIMLSPDFLTSIGIFALLESGCEFVFLLKNGKLLGKDDNQDNSYIAGYYDLDEIVRSFSYHGTAKDRNIHQMTGRIE